MTNPANPADDAGLPAASLPSAERKRGTTVLVAPIAMAEPESEVLRLFRQWYDLVMTIHVFDDWERPDAEAYLDGLHEQRYAVLDRVSELDPATAEGVMAQVMMTCDFGEEWLSNSHWGQQVRDRVAARIGISFPSYVQA